MNTGEIKRIISINASEVVRLHKRIHETLRYRGRDAQGHKEWKEACAQFHARYDSLAFPGGYEAGVAGIASGDAVSIETALCFLEVRPYFFRSGYMYKVLLRKIKRANLFPEQLARLEVVLERQALWRAKRVGHVAA